MTVEEVENEQTVEEVDELNKEAREYSQEYIRELIAAAKEYLPKPVWEHIHRQGRSKAGGRASGKARAAATDSSATTPSPEPADQAAAVGVQPPVVEPTQNYKSAAYPDVEKQGELHPDCLKVAQNCQKMKKSDEEETEKCKDKEDDVDKTAHGKQDAPIADTGAWDAGAAETRLLAWAGGPDKDKVDWGKFGKGFLYHDPANADNIGGYKFPVADIVGGKFQINRSALAAAAGRINQSSGIPASELDSMKATLRSYYKDIGEDAPDNIAKEEEPAEPINPYIGSRSALAGDISPLVTFVAASPGVIESLRKEALVGPAGRIFNEQYLKPLGLTRDQVAITYLIPRLLKDEAGHVREPTQSELSVEKSWKEEQTARRAATEGSGAPSESLTVALGHTVKKTLGDEVVVTLPHPNALGTSRTNEELIRKREQLKRMIDAKLYYAKYGRFSR